MSKKPARWGPTAPPTVLHPGFGEATAHSVVRKGLEHYVEEAVEYGFMPAYRGTWSVVLQRHHAGGNTGARAGVGFLLFGFIGAAVAAGSTANARVERIKIWADSHGAIYVKSI